jgi:hypothetical protein
MRFLSIFLGILFIVSVSFAENRIYRDVSQNKEVVDVSGVKTLDTINKDFSGNFTDVTDEVNAKIQLEKDKAKDNAQEIEIAKQAKAEELKKKLNLDEQDWQDLKQCLK